MLSECVAKNNRKFPLFSSFETKRGGGLRGGCVILASVWFSFFSSGQAIAVNNLVKNGGLEQEDKSQDPKPGKTAHWTGYVWEGQGRSSVSPRQPSAGMPC